MPPLAQIALEEAKRALNLNAELEERPLEAFTFHDKGFVVSVGARPGVADIADITTGAGSLTLQRMQPSGSTAICQAFARMGPLGRRLTA